MSKKLKIGQKILEKREKTDQIKWSFTDKTKMEFHDDDNEDHLVGAVRGEHEEEFMSPTALALLESQRQKSAESQRQRIPVATEKVSVLDPQRYQELPDYARKSFVQEEKRRNGNDSCITQQGSSSIDQEGAYSVVSLQGGS